MIRIRLAVNRIQIWHLVIYMHHFNILKLKPLGTNEGANDYRKTFWKAVLLMRLNLCQECFKQYSVRGCHVLSYTYVSLEPFDFAWDSLASLSFNSSTFQCTRTRMPNVMQTICLGPCVRSSIARWVLWARLERLPHCNTPLTIRGTPRSDEDVKIRTGIGKSGTYIWGSIEYVGHKRFLSKDERNTFHQCYSLSGCWCCTIKPHRRNGSC